ncbi:MAG: stage II sporulation protein M [Chitinophagaceae bacterium]
MKESQFIQQNVDKWKEMEIRAKDSHTSSAALAHDFIELTDDLAYCRTFYPNGQSLAFLNGLTRQYHQKIYTNRKEEKGRFYWYWQYELPELFYTYRRFFFYAFLFFVFFVTLGAVSARYDENYVRLILGDSYVNMTLDNMAKGKPYNVYASAGAVEMFFMIAINNIRVAFLSFVSGIVFGIGPIFMNVQNSIMLGAFEYLFFSKNRGFESITVIFIHGTLEIWSIVIAIGSGMILGAGLLFPGTYGRWQSLTRAARDGVKIVLGLVPLFLVAAFLESFVTRYAAMPLAFRLAILGGSLGFLVFYFIIYPHRLHKKILNYMPEEFPSKKNQFAQWFQKKSNSDA